MLRIGDNAPAFTLDDQDGRPVALTDLLAQGPVVLYFYPMDFTPVCTKQACMVRDAFDDLRAAGVEVVAINTAGPRSHSRFAETFKLPFRVLSDPGREVAAAYDASGVFGLMTRRVSYLIDADGRIADREHADWRVGPHRSFIDRVLKRAAR